METLPVNCMLAPVEVRRPFQVVFVQVAHQRRRVKSWTEAKSPRLKNRAGLENAQVLGKALKFRSRTGRGRSIHPFALRSATRMALAPNGFSASNC